MRIKEVMYQRVRSLGNYETERVELIAVVNEGEEAQKVFQVLKDEAEEMLYNEKEERPDKFEY